MAVKVPERVQKTGKDYGHSIELGKKTRNIREVLLLFSARNGMRQGRKQGYENNIIRF